MNSPAFASQNLAICQFHIDPHPNMALKTSATPYIALLSLIVSVIPGFFWLYRRMTRHDKSGKNNQQETRRSLAPMNHNERQFSPTFFYLEESRCRQAWILQQDVSTNTSCHASPASHQMPGYSIAAQDPGSRVVSLGARLSNTYKHYSVADQPLCRATVICGMSVALPRILRLHAFACGHFVCVPIAGFLEKYLSTLKPC